MSAFEFATAQRIKFGPGSFRQLGVLTHGFGQRVALVTGSASLENMGRLPELEAQFRESGLKWRRVTLNGEPTVEQIDAMAAGLRPFAPEAVVGIGGGSVLDAAKALAALLANGGSALDYLEGVGNGATLAKPSLPCVAVPTTAGTGSEATRNAVIGNAARSFKKSMRSATMLPALALVDPDLTQSCPPEVAAACGMDALTQLIESYTSTRSNPFTDPYALQGIAYAAELPFLLADPADSDAREALSLAALMGGICLANAGLGAVHGLVSPLGAFFPIPHGAACAALLPFVTRMNVVRSLEQGLPLPVLRYSTVFETLAGASNLNFDEDGEMEPDGEDESLAPGPREVLPENEAWSSSAADQDDADETGERGDEPDDSDIEALDEGQIDFEAAADNAMRLVQYLEDMVHSLKLPGLRHYGVRKDDFPRIVAGARGNSMQTNPVKLTDDDLTQILDAAW